MIAYADCFSGISGDMTLGALLDAGGDPSLLDRVVELLGLSSEVRIETGREQRGHVGGTRVLLEIRNQRRRDAVQLEQLVGAADLPTRVRERSLTALRRLADAESRIHGIPRERLHLHELGGADTLVDIVGAFWLLDALRVTQLYASPLPAPRGWVGETPLPAPASLEVLAGTGAILQPVDSSEELVTPTGAVILATAARFSRPEMRLLRVGYGIGARARPGNALAIWLGDTSAAEREIAVLETNLDDMAPNLLGALVEDLLAAGALDVTVTPALMKKGRPGHVLAVLAEPAGAAELTRMMLRQSTTLGVRVRHTTRVVAARREVEVETPLGRARVKVKYDVDGSVLEVGPEFEDCRRLARATGRPLHEVIRVVGDAGRRQVSEQ